MHKYIKNWLKQNKLPPEILVIYGGSVTDSNCHALLEQESVDGFLIGGASLKVDQFRKILEISNKLF